MVNDMCWQGLVGLNSIWGMDCFLHFCSVMGQSAIQGNLTDSFKRFGKQAFVIEYAMVV